MRTIVQLYGSGLTRLLEIVDETAGESGPAIFEHLAGDKLVAGLLLLTICIRTRSSSAFIARLRACGRI